MAEPTIYVSRPGDNLTHIAAQYGTTIAAILAANGVTNPNRIYAGQALTIPSADQPAVVETPGGPEPMASEVFQEPVADAPSGDASIAEAPQGDATYTVQPGDSAIKIARRFGIDEEALLAANAITNPNRVYVGQVLTIPG
jgi:putative chitinase